MSRVSGMPKVDTDMLIQTDQTMIQINWKNVKISTKDGKKILDGVSGTVAPGQFLSIIGASGAGKTTLLNYLSGRLISKGLKKSGPVRINGDERDTIKGFSSICAFVQQFDILFQTLTVRECLEFAAKLKLKGTKEEKQQRVDKLIQELRLIKCQHTKIGGPLVKGVSGGERKRCSIGVELITDPFLVFLDEPTTGLDSFTATSVMQTLQELARTGKTIIQTIHQPNTDMFEAMDRLMLLAKGKIIYLNEANKAVDYFTSINFKPPDLCNPADYFMAIMSVETIEAEMEEKEGEVDRERVMALYQKQISYLGGHYEKSELYCDPDSKTNTMVRRISKEEQERFAKQASSWCYQFTMLANRNFLNMFRLPESSQMKFAVMFLAAGFTCTLFAQFGQDVTSVQNRNGSLFFVIMVLCFLAIQSVILIFPDERPVFLREANSGMYKVTAYFMAKLFSELPFGILVPGLFSAVVYWACGYNQTFWYNMPIFTAINILVYNASAAMSLIIGCTVADKQLAVALTPVLVIPMMLYAGFFVSVDKIPKALAPIGYLSFFKYGFQAMAYNEYDGLHLECQDETDPLKFCDPINDLGLTQEFSECIIALGAMIVGLYIIALLIMLRLSGKYE